MKRLLSLALVTIALAIAAPAQAADKLTLLLDWFVNPDHAPVIVAQEKGYFADENLDVEIVPPADPSAPPRLVAAGQGDIAISYQPSLHQQIGEGLPLVRIGTIVETPLNTLVALEGGEVKTLADLKGKTIGFSVGGFEDALLKMMLSQENLTLDDVKLVNVNFALSPALIAGKVDVVIGAFRNFELTQLDIEGKTGLAFYPEEHGVPVYDELIFVAHKDRTGDEKLLRFMRAIEKATIWMTNHPDEGWELFKAAHPDLDNALNQRAWVDTMPRFAKRPFALDVGRYERFGEFMKEQGLIKETVPVSDYAVTLR
ncbi:ABC transporter substrate-binding protein [Tepidamorphus sp. 3E244]|uniref:ABC transporter substrate-binding protein n=1 Tax=Tepidamorphus sp. 3E244 TaxID=3385498 RepID=UPI0038FD1573